MTTDSRKLQHPRSPWVEMALIIGLPLCAMIGGFVTAALAYNHAWTGGQPTTHVVRPDR